MDEGEEQKLQGSLLLICQSWGYRGATREAFYKDIKGLNYSDMKNALAILEEKGYVTLEWVDFDRFFAYITPEGEEHLNKWLYDLRV